MNFSNGVDNAENYRRSVETAVVCPPEEDLAVQDDAENADINVIVERYNSSGKAPPVSRSVPYFADVSQGFDLHEAMTVTRQAQEAFDLLPSNVRLRFNNDPRELARFVSIDGNRVEAAHLGLLSPEAAEAVLAPKPVPAAPAAPTTSEGPSS